MHRMQKADRHLECTHRTFTVLLQGELTSPPEDGAYISGMYVEGARWDPDIMMLAESLPKVLHECPCASKCVSAILLSCTTSC